MKRAPRQFERGFSQWLILVILMIGIGVGVWVAQVRTSLVPQAAPDKETATLQTSMSLKLENDNPPQLGRPFLVHINLRSEIDSVRLVSAQLKYDPNLLEIIKVENPAAQASASASPATDSAQPATAAKQQHWLETLFDNKDGKASLTALYPQSDLKTSPQEHQPHRYTSVLFRPKASGETEIKLEDTTVMLRAADNANIITKRDNLKVIILDATESGKLAE